MRKRIMISPSSTAKDTKQIHEDKSKQIDLASFVRLAKKLKPSFEKEQELIEEQSRLYRNFTSR